MIAPALRVYKEAGGRKPVTNNFIKVIQSQRKAMPKNAQTTAQLHSSHMLVK